MLRSTPIFLVSLLFCTWTFAQSWQSTTENIYSFSSPRCVDLNGDGVLDVVFGAGIEGAASDKGVIALNGADGSTLWEAFARDQIFGSPVFLDINQDGTADVVIGGRNAEFRALDGTDGSVIWEFYSDALATQTTPQDSGIYQFYTPQLVPDIDGDGLQDLLNANGGDPSVLLPNEPRPAGSLMLISSATGELLARAEVPDQKESYLSPLVVDFFQDGDLEIIFGTGGEANPGSLWRVPLSSLINEDLSDAISLIDSDTKGMIAPPSLADLNEDNVPDIVCNTYDGRIEAIDGRNNQTLWSVQIPMGETNASPGIGFFNEDNIPDVYCNFGIGLAPTFIEFVQLTINGKDGSIIQQDSLGLVQFSSPTVLDYDQDGYDEIIYCINDANTLPPDYFLHELLLIDINDQNQTSLNGPIGGANVNATPWIGNLDNDGLLDLVYTHNTDSTMVVNPNGTTTQKLSLNIVDNTTVAWGAYLGNQYDGLFQNTRSNCSDFYEISINDDLGENCAKMLVANSSGCPTPDDCTFTWDNGQTGPNRMVNEAGRYSVAIEHPDGCIQVGKVDFAFSEVEFTNIQITPPSCNGSTDGQIRIDFTGGVPPYQTVWDGTPSTGLTTAQIFLMGELEARPYVFQVVDALGCSYILDVMLEATNDSPIQINWENIPESSDGASDGGLQIELNGGMPPYTLLLNNDTIENWTMIDSLLSGAYVVFASDANGCMSDTIVVVDLSTGLLQANNAKDMIFRIFPNPATDYVQLRSLSPNYATSEVSIRMYKTSGQLFESKTVPKLPNQPIKLDLSHYPPGVYFFHIIKNSKVSVHKLLKY